MRVLVLRHIEPNESTLFLHLIHKLALRRRIRFLSKPVECDLFRDLGLTDAGATKEKHDEGPVRVHPPILAQTKGVRDGTDWTTLTNNLLTQNLFQLDYANIKSVNAVH